MDLLDAHGRAMDVFDRAVHKVGISDWDSPSPCTDWTVKDLVNHVVGEQLWVPELLAGKTMAEVGDKFDGDILNDDPIGTWEAAAAAARAAWVEPGALDRTVRLSFGDTAAREYCWQMTVDLAVHGWDLARALGSDPGIGDELATALLGFVEPQAQAWQGSGMFADPVPVADDADPQTRLVAMLGREPTGAGI
ncbi:TIGR03086 family metal-binding protein [Actinophytocola xanthii]|uniref:TIGR03086 family protein n=1 Tax=Actinophytocola xanthii TaxID=1912961 RepID=A0A1Q8CL66_9PSEU|nr:TIGR03086 family metal-binding protein [Actinophytocola xanthii]OLF15089.1 TIGR03086 family protein [Actinophytocola xanthii]